MYSSLVIIIPVYNEGENIRRTLAEIRDKVHTPHRVLIVYDFEEDSTVPVAREVMRETGNIRLQRNRYGRGALNAIRTGLEEVGEGVGLVVMADLSDDMGTVDRMFELVNRGYDIVCGSRYMRGGRQIGGPRVKKLLSRAAGLSLHYVAGVPTRDATNSFKMYTGRVLAAIPIESTGGFEVGLELVVKAHARGYRVTEVPSTWRDRSAGESRFRVWRWLPHYLRWYSYALANRVRDRAAVVKPPTP